VATILAKSPAMRTAPQSPASAKREQGTGPHCESGQVEGWKTMDAPGASARSDLSASTIAAARSDQHILSHAGRQHYPRLVFGFASTNASTADSSQLTARALSRWL
jgi:hypothetical protein